MAAYLSPCQGITITTICTSTITIFITIVTLVPIFVISVFRQVGQGIQNCVARTARSGECAAGDMLC